MVVMLAGIILMTDALWVRISAFFFSPLLSYIWTPVTYLIYTAESLPRFLNRAFPRHLPQIDKSIAAETFSLPITFSQ